MEKGEPDCWYTCGNTESLCLDSYISKLTSLERSWFQRQLKLAEVIPVFKREDELSKENYCLVSVLSQINLFFKSKFSSMLTEFHKNHNTQNALLNMTEKWKHLIKANIGIIFMDLSKSFDALKKQFTIYYLPN